MEVQAAPEAKAEEVLALITDGAQTGEGTAADELPTSDYFIGIALGELPEDRLRDLAHSLANEPAGENAAWRDQLAGVDAGHAQRVAEAAGRMTHADLQAAHAALLGEQGGCWLLTNRA